jgi:hypothetical protein
VEEAKIQALWLKARSSLRASVVSILSCVDSDEDIIDAVHVALEAVALELGYVEGTACLLGVSRKHRTDSIERGVYVGKAALLEAHNSTPCGAGCEEAKQLWNELHPS